MSTVAQEKARRYYLNHRDERKLKDAEYRRNNKERIAAQTIVQLAIRKGELGIPKGCQICGEETVKIHAHHADYSRPLDVAWLCPACHFKIHGKHLSGRQRYHGSQIKNSKLIEEEVSEIKDLLRNGISRARVAKKYNVSETTIALIARGEMWKYVA